MVGPGSVLREEEGLEEHSNAPRSGEEIGQAECAADGACQRTGALGQGSAGPGEGQPARDPPGPVPWPEWADTVEAALLQPLCCCHLPRGPQ